MSDKFMQYPAHRKNTTGQTLHSGFDVGDRVTATVTISDGEFDMPYAKEGDVLRIIALENDGRDKAIAVCHEVSQSAYLAGLDIPEDIVGKSLEDLAFYVNKSEIIKAVHNPYMDRHPPTGCRYVDVKRHKKK
jgi:hypothetical protein